MLVSLAEYTLVTVYMTAAFVLMLYGINCYVMVYLFVRNREKSAREHRRVWAAWEHFGNDKRLPRVTTQIPIYNEYNVAERIIRSACNMAYPKEMHEIQVLDDSTDETRMLIDDLIDDLSKKGHDIVCIRRHVRTGFKAGALSEGLEKAKGAFVAIFDADFVPPQDFLVKTLPFFMENETLGLVQARWGHLNADHSLLTRAQSLGIDGHFMVEQSARYGAGLYMNFNGTAGVFRTQAIVDAGGWQWDTLTEDMDLSYRMQFAGWRTMYLPELVVPAEIPENIRAFKSQQFRWAKGSMETAIKLFPQICKAPVPVFRKVQALFHLTHYLVHPLMLALSLLAWPVMHVLQKGPGPLVFAIFAVFIVFSMTAPSTLYWVSQKAAYPDWGKRMAILPFLIITGTGLALSNSRAVFEALIGHKSPFVRTPKKGDRNRKQYRSNVPVSAVLELLLGVYCAISFGAYFLHGRYLVGPFLGIYAAGYLFTGFLTLVHSMDNGAP